MKAQKTEVRSTVQHGVHASLFIEEQGQVNDGLVSLFLYAFCWFFMWFSRLRKDLK